VSVLLDGTPIVGPVDIEIEPCVLTQIYVVGNQSRPEPPPVSPVTAPTTATTAAAAATLHRLSPRRISTDGCLRASEPDQPR
jgi:hypothetical protein